MKYANVVDGVVIQTGPVAHEGFIEVPEYVTAGMLQSGADFVESPEAMVARYDQALEAYTDQVARDKGYKNIDSISKYLVTGNYFKPEAEALSLWVGNVWYQAQLLLNDYTAGNIPQPTIEDVMATLPPVPVKGTDYTL